MRRGARETILLAHFREFHGEVVRLRAQVELGDGAAVDPGPSLDETLPWAGYIPGQAGPGQAALGPAGAIDPVGGLTDAGNGEEMTGEVADPSALLHTASLGAAGPVWKRLLFVLQRQGLAVRRTDLSYEARFYGEAQYLMAAFADEVFLHLDWAGRQGWRRRPLETHLFGTQSAGEVVFRRIDDLLADRDPVYRELARLYLAALGLGFEGRYRALLSGDPGGGRGLDAARELARYRRRLFRFLADRDPSLDALETRVSPSAYLHTLGDGKGRKMPHLAPWIAGIALAIAGFLVLSFGIWRSRTTGLEDVLNRILAGGA